MKYFDFEILGLKRKLPYVKVADNLALASFVCLSDTELVQRVAPELVKRLPEVDVLMTAEAKGICLTYEMSRIMGMKEFVVARKSCKPYMQNVVSHTLRSITTQKEQTLYLDGVEADKIRGKRVAIIDEHDTVHMAHMDIHFGFSINGVAALHTKILEDTELHPFYEIYPEKFSNKTNGITFRRWIHGANPALASLLDDVIGTDWRSTGDLSKLAKFADDKDVLERLAATKVEAKAIMRQFMALEQGVTIPSNAIIDVQVKRIHEYKRQQMLALYIIWKYLDIKNGNRPEHPVTIIFGGKAAPAYTIAQDIIHLILTLSQWIANDPDVAPYLQVVMIENYNVTAAERVIPAADISEQISLASKEASGTSNMKFMLNGALTLCTLDGANVEIAELVGDENIYTFGASSKQVEQLYADGTYNAGALYRKPGIKLLVDFITNPAFMATGNAERLQRLHDDIKGKDWFMALLDIEEYIQTKERVLADYEDQDAWMRKALINIANAGTFSSDRTISQYNDEIWHLS